MPPFQGNRSFSDEPVKIQTGTVLVKVIGAKGFKSTTEAVVKLEFEAATPKEVKTTPVRGSAPEWNQEFTVAVERPEGRVNQMWLHVKDVSKPGGRDIGYCKIAIGDDTKFPSGFPVKIRDQKIDTADGQAEETIDLDVTVTWSERRPSLDNCSFASFEEPSKIQTGTLVVKVLGAKGFNANTDAVVKLEFEAATPKQVKTDPAKACPAAEWNQEFSVAVQRRPSRANEMWLHVKDANVPGGRDIGYCKFAYGDDKVFPSGLTVPIRNHKIDTAEDKVTETIDLDITVTWDAVE